MGVSSTVAEPNISIDLTGLRHAMNEKYYRLLWDERRFVVLMGGAGSGKSFAMAQKHLVRLVTEPGIRILALRKIGKTCRRSVFQLLIDVLSSWGWTEHFSVNHTDMTFEFRPKGSLLLCAGLDDPEKLKSIAGISCVWMEEATEFTEADLNQVNLRLRGITGCHKQITLTFNPISAQHWLKRRFWDSPTSLGDIRRLTTTYLDNRFLDEEYIRELEQLRIIDEALWRVYARGEWGVFKGLIYPAWEMVETWPKHFHDLCYGLDFGFNVPSALVEVGVYDGEPFPSELIYESGLTTGQLISLMRDVGVSQTAPIYADAAEPDRIQEICNAGFNCMPADKDVIAGIMTVRQRVHRTKPANINLNREASMYRYRETKDGLLLDEPVKANDHALDALRYAIHTHLGPRGGGVALDTFDWK